MLGKFSGACRHISSLDREYTLWQDASRSFCISRVSEDYSGIYLTGISSMARIEYRRAGRVVSTPGRCSRKQGRCPGKQVGPGTSFHSSRDGVTYDQFLPQMDSRSVLGLARFAGLARAIRPRLSLSL